MFNFYQILQDYDGRDVSVITTKQKTKKISVRNKPSTKNPEPQTPTSQQSVPPLRTPTPPQPRPHSLTRLPTPPPPQPLPPLEPRDLQEYLEAIKEQKIIVKPRRPRQAGEDEDFTIKLRNCVVINKGKNKTEQEGKKKAKKKERIKTNEVSERLTTADFLSKWHLSHHAKHHANEDSGKGRMGNTSSSTRYHAFDVDTRFEVPNGLTGMLRDILLLIFRITQSRTNIGTKFKDRIIRAVIGMCQEHFMWKSHPNFKRGRVEFTCLSYNFKYPVTSEVGYTGGLTSFGARPQCVFDSWGLRYREKTVFLAKAVKEGVVRWIAKIVYAPDCRSQFHLGIAPPTLVAKCQESFLGNYGGTCAFKFWRTESGVLGSSLTGVGDVSAIPSAETTVPDSSLVALELNLYTQRLSFCVGDKKVPLAIRIGRVRPPLRIGLSGSYKVTLLSILFQRLAPPSPSLSLCRSFECAAVDPNDEESENEDQQLLFRLLFPGVKCPEWKIETV